MKWLSRVALSLGLLAIVVLFWWGLGAKTFTYWKTKRISRSDWAAMGAYLEQLITKATPENATNGRYIMKEEIPEYFGALGSMHDGGGGFAYRRGEETMVYVRYGNKARSWGLFYGTEWVMRRQFSQCTATQVSTNAFFYIGPFD